MKAESRKFECRLSQGVTVEDVVDGTALLKTSSWAEGGSVLLTRAEAAAGVNKFRRYVRAEDGRLVLEMHAGDVVCKRIFSRK